MKKNKIKFDTTYLLPKNDFWVGLGSTLNLAGSYFDYKYSNSSHEADSKALKSDWENVGNDIKNAKNDFEVKSKLCLK